MSSNSSIDQVLHKRSDLHMLRKLWHISTGTLGLWIFYTSKQSTQFWAILTLAIAILGFAFDYLRVKSLYLNQLTLKVMGPFMRRSEREGVSGLPFYALGVSLALFFYDKHIAILSTMFLVYADPLSSFFGVLYGKDKILPNKSLQGSLAGFFTCYLITLFYCMNFTPVGIDLLIFAVIAGIIGSVSELISALNVDDNLTIPVFSGLGVTILNYFLKIIP